MIISLTGFMGCGKSSVGRKLSELLCCPFMDLDAVIEEQAGLSIPEIFEAHGDTAFRQMELAALQHITNMAMPIMPATFSVSPSTPALILSLGGGTVMTPECEALVHEHTVCIYLRTSIDSLVARLANESANRPLLNTNIIPSEVEESPLRRRIESLMAQRASTYERTAHITIDTDGHTIDSLVKKILKISELQKL